MDNVWNTTSQNPIYIRYQMDFPGVGDPYYTGEVGGKRAYYGVNSVPTAMIDGGWKGNSNFYTSSILDQFSEIPANAIIESNYKVTGQTVDVQVSFKALTDLLSNNNRLHVAIFEYTTFNNVKNNGETEFHHVFKKFIPNNNGTTIGPILAGEPKTYEFSYTFQGNYRLPTNSSNPINHTMEHSVEGFGDLGVAVWVQEHSSRTIWHGAYALDQSTDLDLEISTISTPASVEKNIDAAITGMVTNNQSTVVTSFDLVYQIDGGTEYRENISGVNLTKGDTYNFSHSNLWTPTNEGFYRIEARIDNINGAGMNTFDDLTVNDASFKYIEVVDQLSKLSSTELGKAIKVYPNPSNGQVTISSSTELTGSVEVYNLVGEKVSSLELGQRGFYNLDLSKENSGIYMLRFQTESGIINKRVIIQ